MFIQKKFLIVIVLLWAILFAAIPFFVQLGFNACQHELGYGEAALDVCIKALEERCKK